MEYLTQIGRTFYCRLPIPIDLRERYSANEIKKSLGTRNRQEAKLLLAKLIADYKHKFFLLRYSNMDQRPPEQRAITAFNKLYPSKPLEIEQAPNLRGRVKTLWHPLLMDIQDELDRGGVVDENGVLILAVAPATVAPATVPVAVAPAMKSLKAAISEYETEIKQGTDKTAPLSASHTATCVRKLRQLAAYTVIDDLEVAALKAEEFSLHLQKTGSRGKPLKKDSLNVYMGYLTVFFKWCVGKHYLAEVPLLVRATKSIQEVRDKGNRIYTTTEVQTILNALSDIKSNTLLQRKIDLSFVYFCLTALFTGFRSGEVIELHKNFFRTDLGITVIDLHNSAGTLKTLNAYRILPIHNKLSELYFLEYTSKVSANKIFGKSYSTYTGRMNKILYSLDIKSAPYEALFHSFRHVFDSSMDALGTVPENHRKMLLGHQKSGMDKVYVHCTNEHLPAFNRSVQAMPFNYDFSKLKDFLRGELNYLYP